MKPSKPKKKPIKPIQGTRRKFNLRDYHGKKVAKGKK